MSQKAKGQTQQGLSLRQLLSDTHPLVQLAKTLDWQVATTQFARTYVIPPSASQLPARALLALSILRGLYDLGEEDLYRQWLENPYFQYFSGFEDFQRTSPFDPLLLRLLPRIGHKELQSLTNEPADLGELASSAAPAPKLPSSGAGEPAVYQSPLGQAARPGRKAPRIYDVASAAGVSVKTVSLVINNHPNVSDRTRAAVHKAMKSLAFRPNVFARGLATLSSNLIALLYDGPGEFATDLESGALERCRAAGYHLVVESLSAKDTNLRERMRKLLAGPALHGVIVVPPLCDAPEVVEELAAAATRCIRINPGKTVPRMAAVAVDEFRIGYEMTQYLIEIGHRRIGFISGTPDHLAAAQRGKGYRAALKAAGLDFDKSLCVEGAFSFESGKAATSRLLALAQRPTAIFAASDHMAAGALAQAHMAGLNVPHDVSIVGVDDSVIASTVWPQLTTCHTPIKDLARVAASLLLQDEDKTRESNVLLQHSLVVRGSSAPPSAAKRRKS
jgi:LacI family transcriptional regulator